MGTVISPLGNESEMRKNATKLFQTRRLESQADPENPKYEMLDFLSVGGVKVSVVRAEEEGLAKLV